MTRRTQQMGEFLREEVIDIIRTEIDDPRLGFWTITRVEALADLRSARVYVSVLGSDAERQETIAALRGAAGFIRGHLKPRMRTRVIPTLDFQDDRSMEYAEEIGRTLRSLKGGTLRSGGDASLRGDRAEENDRLSPRSSLPPKTAQRSTPPFPPAPPPEDEA